MGEDKGRSGRPQFVRIKRAGARPSGPETVTDRESVRVTRQEEPTPADMETLTPIVIPRQDLRAVSEGGRPEADTETRARIVIPRQDLRAVSEGERPEADIELREVRHGRTSHGPYLRVVPTQRRFIRIAPSWLEATPLASVPQDTLGRYLAGFKRVIIGSPFATSQAIRERLTKVKALPIFASDALSSSAYATEEILIMLALAGSGALADALPISAAIVLLLAIVTLSYRQTIRAYPSGGGAYIVAHENLGRGPGLAAAAALMVDYVLTVAVSIAAGMAAITSAMPGLYDLRVLIGVAVVGLFTLGNLRGVRESGTLFAAPTYFFVLAMGTMIVVGLIKVVTGNAPGSLLHGAPPRQEVVASQGLTLFLVLRAFASGSAALTGVEAISNGVPAFKPPESQNARATLATMACILAFLVLGVTYLSTRYGLVPQHEETIVSMLGREILGKNALYYGYQAATALVLFMAANTSFADFPRLSAILANDRFMPRQFAFKGDRLAFSHGIVLLAAAASLLLVVFAGNVTRLIPLYAVGVFVSFTLSQSGMVRHWWRLRDTGWRRSLVINCVGAATTAVVAAIIASTKFTHGAWISILLMLALMLMFVLIRRHYAWFEEEMRVGDGVLPSPILRTAPAEPLPLRGHVVLPVAAIDKVTVSAALFAREGSKRVTAVHIADDREKAEQFRARWKEILPDIPLLLIESPYRAFLAPLLAYLETLQRAEPGVEITLVLPRFVPRHLWERPLHTQHVLSLRPHLKKRPGVTVLDLPYPLEG
jgi:amino acid transporter